MDGCSSSCICEILFISLMLWFLFPPGCLYLEPITKWPHTVLSSTAHYYFTLPNFTLTAARVQTQAQRCMILNLPQRRRLRWMLSARQAVLLHPKENLRACEACGWVGGVAFSLLWHDRNSPNWWLLTKDGDMLPRISISVSTNNYVHSAVYAMLIMPQYNASHNNTATTKTTTDSL